MKKGFSFIVMVVSMMGLLGCNTVKKEDIEGVWLLKTEYEEIKGDTVEKNKVGYAYVHFYFEGEILKNKITSGNFETLEEAKRLSYEDIETLFELEGHVGEEPWYEKPGILKGDINIGNTVMTLKYTAKTIEGYVEFEGEVLGDLVSGYIKITGTKTSVKLT